jgi:hypothetical protein
MFQVPDNGLGESVGLKMINIPKTVNHNLCQLSLTTKEILDILPPPLLLSGEHQVSLTLSFNGNLQT